MNQIILGKGCVMDTDDVQFSVIWPKDAQTRAYLRGRTEAIILRGDAKVAFDAWAETLRPVPEAGVRELCKPCGFRNVHNECKHDTEGATYPECFEDEDA